jgi:hypothetical protein
VLATTSSKSFVFLSPVLKHKVEIYKIIILPVVFVWVWNLVSHLENRVLRRRFGPKREEVTGGWGGGNCMMRSFTIHMRCGYYVPGKILLQACLCTYSLLRGVTFEVLPLSSYTLSPTMLPLLERFVEILLYNCFQCHYHIFFGCLQYPEIFVPLRQTLFLETARSHSEPNEGTV